MQKTKLGVSVGLLGAALYFLGMVNVLGAFILAGYVLLVEENEWLRKSAVKMVAIVITFSILGVGVSFVEEIFSVLNIIFGWMAPFTIRIPFNLNTLLRVALSFVENVLLIMMGFTALSMGTIKIKFLDTMIGKHLQNKNMED